MKRLLFLLLLFAGLNASAFTVEYVPKDAANKFGIVAVKQNKFAYDQPVVIFLAGIGERGDGSKAGLSKIANWNGINLKNDQHSFFAATDAFGFNIVCVQTASEYQNGEIFHAVSYAVRVLGADANQIHLVANSLGGFGFAREVSKDASLARHFASIAMVVMGPGTGANTAKNIAASGVPIWFFTSSDDTKNGTNPDVTRKLFKDVVAAGGNAWLTEWTSGGHNVLTRVVGAWFPPLGWKIPWAMGTNAVVPLYQWQQNNKRGYPVKAPTDPFDPPKVIFVPTPAPVPVPTKRAMYIIWSDGTWSEP